MESPFTRILNFFLSRNIKNIYCLNCYSHIPGNEKGLIRIDNYFFDSMIFFISVNTKITLKKVITFSASCILFLAGTYEQAASSKRQYFCYGFNSSSNYFFFHISRKKVRIQIDNSIFLTTWLSYSSNSSGLVLIDIWKLVYKNTIPHGCQLSNQVFFISLKYYNSWTKLLGRCYRVPSSSEVVDTMEPNPFWSRI